jgi:hypothetical protein
MVHNVVSTGAAGATSSAPLSSTGGQDPVNKNNTRLTVVVGTTMALVIAGTAAVSAAGPRDRDDQWGQGRTGIDARHGGKMMPGARGRGASQGGMRGLDGDFERTETSVQTADGVSTRRVEHGVADGADEASLNFSLASGEAVTVVIDEDTQVVAFEEQDVTRRGRSRTRLAPTEVESTDIEPGSEIVVWSDSEDDADFVASRIVIHPADAAEATDAEEATDEVEATEADEVETAEEAVEETTEDAAATDA